MAWLRSAPKDHQVPTPLPRAEPPNLQIWYLTRLIFSLEADFILIPSKANDKASGNFNFGSWQCDMIFKQMKRWRKLSGDVVIRFLCFLEHNYSNLTRSAIFNF